MKSVLTVSRNTSLDGFFSPWNPDENENVLSDIARLCCPRYADLSWKDLCELRDGIDLKTSVYDPGVNAVLQLHALRSKNRSFKDLSVDPLRAAVLKFWESEQSCADINESFRSGSSHSERDVILHYAAKKASKILGQVPSIADLRLQFGPGASSNVKSSTSPRFKLNNCPSVSKDLIQSSYLLGYLENVPHWLRLHKKSLSMLDVWLLFQKTGRRTAL